MSLKDTNSSGKLLVLLCAFISVLACKNDSQTLSEISKIPIDMKLERFDQEFAAGSEENLQKLKRQYPYLFSKRFPDAYWIQKFTDTIQQEINKEVAVAFPDFNKENLEDLFRHIAYYFPKTTIPKIVTITSDVDYRNKIVLADSLLVIGLDNYLGEDHHFYTGIPVFQSKNFRASQIEVDVAAAFAKAQTAKPRTNEFLAQMIYEGKMLYLMKTLLSGTPEYEILGYTEKELNFARENEKNIWEFFIRDETLYNTDRKLLSRFIDPAPFSKFYLSFDNETPGRLGRYMGYEIVKSYMEKSDVPLKTMLIQDAATIFANAKYKP